MDDKFRTIVLVDEADGAMFKEIIRWRSRRS
jgi:hypothetical protein